MAKKNSVHAVFDSNIRKGRVLRFNQTRARDGSEGSLRVVQVHPLARQTQSRQTLRSFVARPREAEIFSGGCSSPNGARQRMKPAPGRTLRRAGGRDTSHSADSIARSGNHSTERCGCQGSSRTGNPLTQQRESNAFRIICRKNCCERRAFTVTSCSVRPVGGLSR